MITINLPNGSQKTFDHDKVSLIDVAKSISNSLAKEVLVGSSNGIIIDTNDSIKDGSKINLFTFNDDEGKNAFWHTSAHLLGAALQELYSNVLLGTGPAIENGFYYDVDFGDYKFTDADFKAVENKMLDLAKLKSKNVRSEVSKQEALAFFTLNQNKYKLELIDGLQDGNITFYKTGDFTDLCDGPHIPDTGLIKAIKITSISGAYWRANEKNKMLTRVYGISFPKKTELDAYLDALEKAKERDHRKLGRELELFYFDEEVGMGLPLWAPKGEALRQNLIGFLKKIQMRAGYQHVATPHIGKKELYITSGHYAKYGQDAFQPIKTPTENEEFFLKPMNCPHHCKIYATKPRSYKELPIKYAEFGTVYRYEQSGELHGLTRVRGFTQDDAHIYCRPDQLKEEFLKVVDLVNLVYGKLGFTDFQTQISLRDPNNLEKYLGTDEMWRLSESAIIEATRERGMKTTTKEGEAAFYGPKLDFMVRDAIGRKWQIGTIQVDYMMPENFNLTYTGSDNTSQRPVMIHRALFGSMERFIALLIEHTAGNFPVWLAPVKVIVLPIASKYNEYSQQIADRINEEFDQQIEVDSREEKIGRKIRDAETQKIPYMVIIGEKEMETQSVSIRVHTQGDVGTVTLNEFIEDLRKNLKIS
ncbi:threonyl-tRNA synthetase [Flavobacterium micromati]|uniref:Threonine--tRNA ligase n=1 Tax=Flavobacterium micromati TaxID=229205 RepID=A0A1M5KNK6_9FLAO|nr:threonine--tRNA ligase [Flavobacterium micromati]SHG54348.1 threonyl-tRNA synthetase [Flavobacterium micromati]